MPRLFGTDGIRGVAGVEITPELMLKLGRATAEVIRKNDDFKSTVLVGKDTRNSSDMLESSLIAGLCSAGIDVISIGVLPTPAVAYLVKQYNADAGIMISASHNPYKYNGIKIFNSDGFKLADELEDRIENLVEKAEKLTRFVPANKIFGSVRYEKNAREDYILHVLSTIDGNLLGLNIAMDCANGCSSNTAVEIFTRAGAEVHVAFDKPNGLNINENCGSTDMQCLCEYVAQNDMHCGVAFDGDADRCLFVDENGEIIDGDFIMAICAGELKKASKLRKNTVVGTIMTNMGFAKFCRENDISFIPTKVGDRYVLEEMEINEYSFGGEQSGHIIFREFSSTGDGQLTAIQLLDYMKKSGKTLSQLAQIMTRYPQILKNITVTNEAKLAFYSNENIKKNIAKYKEDLGERGRIIVRLSGTEPLIRVMVEGEDIAEINGIADDICAVIQNELGGECQA